MAITAAEQTFFNNAISKVFSYDKDDLRYAQKLLVQYSNNIPELLTQLNRLCGCSFSDKAGVENSSPPQAVADSISAAVTASGGTPSDTIALKKKVGDATLTTTNKDLSNAVNELNAEIGAESLPAIGVTGSASTPTSISGAISYLNTAIGNTSVAGIVTAAGSAVDDTLSSGLVASDNKFGDMTSLTTSAKATIVAAVNEVKSSAATAQAGASGAQSVALSAQSAALSAQSYASVAQSIALSAQSTAGSVSDRVGTFDISSVSPDGFTKITDLLGNTPLPEIVIDGTTYMSSTITAFLNNLNTAISSLSGGGSATYTPVGTLGAFYRYSGGGYTLIATGSTNLATHIQELQKCSNWAKSLTIDADSSYQTWNLHEIQFSFSSGGSYVTLEEMVGGQFGTSMGSLAEMCKWALDH